MVTTVQNKGDVIWRGVPLFALFNACYWMKSPSPAGIGFAIAAVLL